MSTTIFTVSAVRPAEVRRARAPRLGPGVPHLVLLLVGLVWATPLVSLVVGALRTDPDSRSSGWWTVIAHPLLTSDNFGRAFAAMGGARTALNSLAVAVPTTVLTVALSATGAYVLARSNFRGRSLINAALVALMVVPPQVTLVPMLTLCNNLGLTGTALGVWLYQVGCTLPFGIFLVRGFMAEYPVEVIEAALVDGAGDLRIFLRLILPAAAPILASLAILQFVWSWNDLLIPLLLLGGAADWSTITVEVTGLMQTTGQGTNLLSAGALIAAVVPLILIVGLQRYFVRGLTAGVGR